MRKTSFLFERTRRQFRWGVVLIVLLAAFLRFYALGAVPHGMYWDEAAIGYNGFAVFTTRRDEWLERLPVSFRSFEDYKAPLAIYLNGFSTAMWGLTLFGVRFPFAVAGVMTVLGMIYLTRVVSVRSGMTEAQARALALAAGTGMALSPWHLHFSRIGFESGLALMCFIWGTYFFYKALLVSPVWRQGADFLLSAVILVASMYAYHSAKLVAPLAAIWLVCAHWPEVRARLKQGIWAVPAGIIAVYPLLKDAIYGHGLARSSAFFFTREMSIWEVGATLASNLLSHLSPDFLILGKTFTLRHGDGMWGVLFPTTLILIVTAFWFVWGKKRARTPLFRLGMVLVLFGFLPAVLGQEVPHSNRALLALPGCIVLAVEGLRLFLKSGLKLEIQQSVIGTLVLFHGLFFVSYCQHYYTQFAAASAADFQDGYLEAFRFVLPYERGEEGRAAVDKILFTSDYGQPYIYALFARKTNPIWYQGGSLIKYEFADTITVGDLDRKNTVVVASMYDDLLGQNNAADHVVYGSDGLPRFRIYIRP